MAEKERKRNCHQVAVESVEMRDRDCARDR